MWNETFYDVLGVGKVKIPLPTEKFLYLSDLFFAPFMRKSIISVSKLAMNGFEVEFEHKEVTIGMRSQVLVNGLIILCV